MLAVLFIILVPLSFICHPRLTNLWESFNTYWSIPEYKYMDATEIELFSTQNLCFGERNKWKLQPIDFLEDSAIKFLDWLVKLYVQVLPAWLMKHSGHNMGESMFTHKINKQLHILPSRTHSKCSYQGDNGLLSFLSLQMHRGKNWHTPRYSVVVHKRLNFRFWWD